MHSRLVAAIALLSLVPCVSLAAEILVPTDHPTIQQAIDAAAEGDTVVVEGGTFEENVVIADRTRLKLVGRSDAAIDGIADSTLTITGSSRIEVSDLRLVGGRRWPVVEILDSERVKIRRSKVTDGGRGITVESSTKVTLADLTVKGPDWSCIHLGRFGNPVDGAVVKKSRIKDCGYHGIWMEAGEGSLIRDNKLRDIGSAKISDGVLGTAITTKDGLGEGGREPRIVGNRISRTKGPCIYVQDDSRIARNRASRCGDAGIEVDGVGNNLVENRVDSRPCAIDDREAFGANRYLRNRFSTECLPPRPPP